MVKRLLIVIMCLGLLGCAGVGLQFSHDSATILQSSAISTVGYLIVKNNPTYRAPMMEWYKTFQGASTLITVQTMFKEGLDKLASSVSKDPYLTMQIQNAMTLLEINVDGPQVEVDIEKYQGYVNAFMMGVLASPCLLYTSPSPRDRQRSRMPSSA